MRLLAIITYRVIFMHERIRSVDTMMMYAGLTTKMLSVNKVKYKSRKLTETGKFIKKLLLLVSFEKSF